jgi:serine/threonine protein kinase
LKVPDLTFAGAPERHRGRRGTLSTQAIDTWSLGCVFSIAATWIVLDSEGIKQYNQLRKKAILRIISKQMAQFNPPKESRLTPGDYFHDGVTVLCDVLDWHRYLRNAVRVGDKITSRVLELIDKKMLLKNAEERVTTKMLCAELKSISDNFPEEVRTEMPNTIMKFLLEVDQEAPAKTNSGLTDTVRSKASALNTVQNRRDRKSEFLGAPLMKTANRSEFLRSELAVRITVSRTPSFSQNPTRPNGPGVNVHGERPGLQESSFSPHPEPPVQSPIEMDGLSNHQSTPPLRDQSGQGLLRSQRRFTASRQESRKNPPQDVFQAREEIEERERGNLLRRTRKDSLLAQYFEDRDIVRFLFQIQSTDFG